MRALSGGAIVLCLVVAGIWLPATLMEQLLFLAGAYALGLFLAWSYVLTTDDKKQITQWKSALPTWFRLE